VKSIFTALLLLLPISAFAQSSLKYFGYFYNDANASFQENYRHINLYHIDQMIIGSGDTVDRDATTQYTLGQLAYAKARGVRAIITASGYLFHWTDSTHSWSADPNAAAAWSTFVNRLIASGYIIPGRPELSTVAAIYVIDEPDGSGFADMNGTANPTLVNAVNVVRNNPATQSIPLASILTVGFPSNIPQGMKLFDWVGFDWYGVSNSDWSGKYNQLKSMLSANQRTIIIPQASLGSGVGNGPYGDPSFYSSVFNTDTKAVWLSPFVWFSTPNLTGTRDIPALRTAYTQIGSTIRASACSLASERAFCTGAAKKTAEIATSLLLQ
jgi:hypothetical protein